MRLRVTNQRGYTIFDVFKCVTVVAGILIGSKYGYIKFGVIGAFVGSIIGSGAGFIVGRLPYLYVAHLTQRNLENETSQRLRERLRSGNEFYIAHLLLAHLMKRGEGIGDELPFIINLLKSDDSDRRRFGWSALKLAFPETASMIAEYQPTDTTDKCQTIVSRLDI